MIGRPRSFTLKDTFFPYSTLVRSGGEVGIGDVDADDRVPLFEQQLARGLADAAGRPGDDVRADHGNLRIVSATPVHGHDPSLLSRCDGARGESPVDSVDIGRPRRAQARARGCLLTVAAGKDEIMSRNPYESRPWLAASAEGVPADIPAPSETLPEMLAAGIRAFPRRPALAFFEIGGAAWRERGG